MCYKCSDGTSVYVDAFNNRILQMRDCASLSAVQGLELLPHYFDGVPPVRVFIRMLTNLSLIFRQLGLIINSFFSN